MPDQFDVADYRRKFTELARPHLDGLYHTALRMTQDQLLTEDIVQETCLKAYADLGRYEPGTNFKAWLFRILNLCINRLRKRAVLSIVPVETVPDEARLAERDDDEIRNPEILAMRGDARRAILKALVAMAHEPRSVVMLILVEGMSYAEAADSLDLPITTVRSMLHRARKQLQKQLSTTLDIKTARQCDRARPRMISLFS